MSRLPRALYRVARRILLPGVSPEDRREMDELVEARLRSAGGRRTRRAAVWISEGVDLLRASARRRVAGTGLRQDAAYSARALLKRPAFALAALAAFALSVGPATAIASFGNRLFWRPLDGVSHADRLAVVWFGTWRDEGLSVSPSGVSSLNLAELRSNLRTADGLAGVQERSVALAIGDGIPRHVQMALVTADFFDVLGVALAAGRRFVPDEDQHPLGAPVAVISAGLANSAFSSPSVAIGRELLLNGRRFSVIGVVGGGFRGISVGSQVDVWLTGATAAYLSGGGDDEEVEDRRNGPFYQFVVRRLPGHSFDQVQADLAALTAGLADRYPDENGKFTEVTARVHAGLGVSPPMLRPRMRRMVSTMAGIGGLLLVLGAANIANLFIASAVRRRPEFALRRALGATSARLVRLLAMEAALVAAVGSALGLALAVVLQQTIGHLLYASAPGIGPSMPIDWRVLGLTAAVATATAAAASLAPAWLMTRRMPGADGVRAGVSSGRRVAHARSALAALQLALSPALVVGAMLLLGTLRNLRSVDLGFDPAGVARFLVSLGEHGYSEDNAVRYQQDLQRLLMRRWPGQVALGQRAPFSSGSGARILPPGAAVEDAIRVNSNGVSDTYFQTLGIELLHGRGFTEAEAYAVAPDDTVPAVLSASLARTAFGEADPLGRTLRQPAGGAHEDRDLLVVGIARDSHWRDVTGAPEPFLYLPLGRYEQPTGATIIVRSRLTLDETTAAVREDAATLDRAVPIAVGLPMAASLDREIGSQRLFSAMLLWVGGIALSLSAIGLYGLVSQAANDRAREFGIRLALGATRGDIGRLVSRYIVFVGASGTVAGLGLAWIASRSLESMLFGVSAGDPLTYAAAAACLVLVVVAATLAPARRATRVQPAQILRAE